MAKVIRPMCSSCRRSEIYDEPATVYVIGKVPTDIRSDREWMPYRAWLCDDHHEALVVDGAELRVVGVANGGTF